MKKLIKIFFAFQCIVICYSFQFNQDVHSQPTTFQKIYGTVNREEFGLSVVQTENNEYIVSSNGYKCMRLDEYGDTLWTGRVLTGSNLLEAKDHNFVFTSIYPIVKFDINGNVLFQTKRYNNAAYTSSIAETDDKGYVLSGNEQGTTTTYPYILKTDSLGNLQWQKTFSNYFFWSASKILPTTNNGYIFTGYDSGAYIIKTDSIGNILLYKSYKEMLSSSEILISLNYGFLIGGGCGIIRIDDNGNVIWNKTYCLDPNRQSLFHSIIKTSDGGFAIGGERDTTLEFDYMPLVLLLKTDSSGNQQWFKMFGNNFDFNSGLDLKQTSDSGYIITGITFSSFSDTTRTVNKNLSLGDLIIIKTDKDGNSPIVLIDEDLTESPKDFALFQNYPNPFNPKTTINYELQKPFFVKLSVFDILGNEIVKLVNQIQNSGKYKTEFDGINLASGVYFLRLEIDDTKNKKNFVSECKKMFLLK